MCLHVGVFVKLSPAVVACYARMVSTSAFRLERPPTFAALVRLLNAMLRFQVNGQIIAPLQRLGTEREWARIAHIAV